MLMELTSWVRPYTIVIAKVEPREMMELSSPAGRSSNSPPHSATATAM